MKSCFGFFVVATSSVFVAEASLYHIPLGRIGGNNNHRRSLAEGDNVDLDALYQARGVQYADLEVGTNRESYILCAIVVFLLLTTCSSLLFLCRMPSSIAKRHYQHCKLRHWVPVFGLQE